jgi:hypothetical protein
MQDANRYDVNNPDFSSEWEAESEESEELLLADLTGSDEADLFFEGLVDRDTGMGRVLERLRTPGIAGSDVTGGDLDDDWYQAEVVGEEAVGGQNPTPDQSVTESLLRSVGIVSRDGEPIHTRDTLNGRDRRRWELDPSSSEDYQERREPE